MLKVVVDGTIFEPIAAVGIGHVKQDLVVVPLNADGKPDTALELGHDWKTVVINRKLIKM